MWMLIIESILKSKTFNEYLLMVFFVCNKALSFFKDAQSL